MEWRSFSFEQQQAHLRGAGGVGEEKEKKRRGKKTTPSLAPPTKKKKQKTPPKHNSPVPPGGLCIRSFVAHVCAAPSTLMTAPVT